MSRRTVVFWKPFSVSVYSEEQAERSQVNVGLGARRVRWTGGGDARLECDEGIWPTDL